MKPVLFPNSATTFTTNGLGQLADALSCLITEERNGVYELEMDYPVTGVHYRDIENGCIIYAKNAYLGKQPFEIYYISRPMDGIVTINARHISYRLNTEVLLPCSATSVAGAISAIESHILDGSQFTFWTDRTTVANWSADVPKNVRAALGGAEGSLLDVYGAGEFEWDGFTVKFHGARGADTGVQIRYGKNLMDLVSEEDAGDLYTACVPFFQANDGTVTVCDKVTSSGWSADNDLVSVLDMGPYFQAPDGAAESWHPTTSQMEAKALSLMEEDHVYAIARHLKVEFALLSQTKEYKQLEALERVNLCDYVTVIHPEMDINVKVKCIKTVWDSLADRYESIELGEPKASLSGTITKDLSEKLDEVAEAAISKTDLEIAVEHATELITGGQGGHVVIGQNADGEPNEIFIMDTDDQSTAVNVIRMNTNGIGFSTTGINGPYTNAWTIDGNLVADFITTGTMNAARIKAGVLQARDGGNYWDMTTGEFQLQATTTAVKTTGTKGSEFWVLGSWASDGTLNDDQKRLRSFVLSDDVAKVTSSGNYDFTVGAWEGDTFKGYLKTNNAIATGTNSIKWTTSFDVAAYRETYPDYDFRILLRNSAAPSTDLDFDTAAAAVTVETIQGMETFVEDQADAVVESELAIYDTALNQQKVFNKLTNNGQTQGIYLQNGKVYINATYIDTGTIDADLITAGTLASQDSGHNFQLVLSTGEMTMKKGSIKLGYDSTAQDYKFKALDSGALTATDATIKGTITSESGNYTTKLIGGNLRVEYNGDDVGKVGASYYSNPSGALGFNIDIGEDADFGGFYVIDNGNPTEGFVYNRSNDWFVAGKPIRLAYNSNVALFEVDSTGPMVNGSYILTTDDYQTLSGGVISGVQINDCNLYPNYIHFDDMQWVDYNDSAFDGYSGTFTAGGKTWTFFQGVLRSVS